MRTGASYKILEIWRLCSFDEPLLGDASKLCILCSVCIYVRENKKRVGNFTLAQR
jgi:hypothetical protein